MAQNVTHDLLRRLIETVEEMNENNQRSTETLRIELGGRIDALRIELSSRIDRLIESTGGHWRDLEKRVEALEDKVFEE